MYIQKAALCKVAQSKIEITKKKRVKKYRERITRCESPSLRSIKKGTNEKSKQLVIRSI